MQTPELSVVLSVYNGGEKLAPTIDSICSQQGVDFEFIIVNDGSSDTSAEILNAYAEQDSRIRPIHQANTGLTRALIRGCGEAVAPFIARQDVGDISLPGRLKTELDLFRKDPSLVMVSCGTRFVLADGEPLYEVAPSTEEVKVGLRALTVRQLRGPSHHGAVMFHTDAYRRVGGYRPAFDIGQDIDLWVQLAEIGEHAATIKILYEAEYSLGGISAGKSSEQLRTGRLILNSAARRRMGKSDDDILRDAEAVTRRARNTKPRKSEALYFIGAALLRRKPEKARDYFRLALRENPGHIKSWTRLLTSYLTKPI